MNDHDFITYFLEKYSALIKKICRRYTISNRYEEQDIIQYIAERILHILSIRKDDNIIVDKEKYFRGCLEFYCSEYQRMHGFIFDLPKRPRKNAQEDEKDIRAKGFKYIGDLDEEEQNLGVLIDNKSNPSNDIEPPNDIAWCTLTGYLLPEDADVIYCIYAKSMTWPETSSYLGVPQSTCWSRRSRALKTLFSLFDNMSGEIKENVKNLLRGNQETVQEIRDSQAQPK